MGRRCSSQLTSGGGSQRRSVACCGLWSTSEGDSWEIATACAASEDVWVIACFKRTPSFVDLSCPSCAGSTDCKSVEAARRLEQQPARPSLEYARARRGCFLSAAAGGRGVLCRHTCRRLRLQAPPGSPRHRRRPRAAAGPLERCTAWNRAGEAAASHLFGAGAERVLNTQFSPHLERRHFAELLLLIQPFADPGARSPLASQRSSCQRSMLRGWFWSSASQPMLSSRWHEPMCMCNS